MSDLVIYDVFDIEPIRRYIMKNGERKVLKRGEYFLSIGDYAGRIGVVTSGAFAFSCPDYKGSDQIMAMAMGGELVCGYIAQSMGRRVEFDVRALCRSEIYVVELSKLMEFIDSSLPDYYCLRLTEAIAYGLMKRVQSYRCDSPELRYRELLSRVSDLQLISNTAIASYLGLSREAFVRLRQRLKSGN